MLYPDLRRLSLARGCPTGGFHELGDAERQQLDDGDVNDPITMERPVHIMTFRVRLVEDNADGTPRYKYFSPEALWEWVKNHNSLPAREGPIWYEDWWALCNTYNPDHRSIPPWAHRLKHRSQYLAEQAAQAQQAVQAQQAARERARAEQEAEDRNPAAAAALNVRSGNPSRMWAQSTNIRVRQEDSLQGLPRLRPGEERYGPQRSSDHLIAWRCWIKGAARADSGERFADAVRDSFAGRMTGGPRSALHAVDRWRQRLVVKTRLFDHTVNRRTLTDPDGPYSPATKIEFELYLSSRYALMFWNWYLAQVAARGYGNVMEHLFGIQNAYQETPGTDTVDRTLRNRGAYQRQHGEPNTPWVFPALTYEQYAQQTGYGGHAESSPPGAGHFATPAPATAPLRQANWMMEEAMAEMRAGDPIIDFRPVGGANTDVTIRWRFWLKGTMSGAEQSDTPMHWRRAFADAMRNAGGGLQIPLRTSLDPWFDRLWVQVFIEDQVLTPPARDGVERPVVRCEFALKLPYPLAQAWLSIVAQGVEDARSWNAKASDWFYVEPVRSTESSDKPHLAPPGDTLRPFSGMPRMTEAEYNDWELWQSVPRFRSLGAGAE